MSVPADELREKVAIITGAGRGIGEAISRSFAREGAALVAVSRTRTELDALAQRIIAAGGRAEIVAGDLSKEEVAKQVIDVALAQYGQIDILVNAAGIYGPIGRVAEVDPEAWLKTVEVNLFGTFLCCRAALRHMITRRQGKIINFSGGGATSPLPCFGAYAASKTAVVRLTETLAEECRSFNIQVNAIAPGMVDTRLQDEVLAAGERSGELLEKVRRMREAGQGWVPVDVPASLALFLASSRSDGLTGKLIAAPHDGWESWDRERIAELIQLPWFTLRRLDLLTLQPLLGQ